MNKSRAVFFDRDGTINKEVHYCSRIGDFEVLPLVPEAIWLLNDSGFKVVVITNQSGIARGYFSEGTLDRIHRKMATELAKYGAKVDAIYYCPHHPDDGCDCRKPNIGLFERATKELSIDLSQSFMVGDQPKDIEAGKRAGCRTVFVGDRKDGLKADYICGDLLKVAGWIIKEGEK